MNNDQQTEAVAKVLHRQTLEHFGVTTARWEQSVAKAAYLEDAAEVLSAAHPTITTVEGMNAPIVASFENGQPLILMDRGCRTFIIWEDEDGDMNVTSWPQEGDPKRLTLLHISLPATVLYWGQS